MEDRRNLIQIANRIHQAQLKLRNGRYLELLNQLKSFAGRLQELAAESRKMGSSLVRGWFFAAGRCCSSVSRLLNEISYSVPRIQQLTEAPRKETAKLSLLVEELNQLQQEFGDIDFDRDGDTLSVVTEPITLEGVYLGPFKIQLELSRLSELYKGSPYRCLALNPNPAATDEDVTHPHVSNEQLCEGDGSVTIRAALEQGRLCDFFVMVGSILNTYNLDSPYVSLADWEGTPCYGCGYVMDRENSCYCGSCDNDFCEECSTYCRSCDESMCLDCAGKCEICEEPVCSNCGCNCAECEAVCCESCLEDGICPNCKKGSEVEKNEEQQENREKAEQQTENKNQPETNDTSVKLAS